MHACDEKGKVGVFFILLKANPQPKTSFGFTYMDQIGNTQKLSSILQLILSMDYV